MTKAPAEARMRIARRIARAGLCSRREAERWIADRRVAVNGRVIDSPALAVGAGDSIAVDGVEIAAPARARLWRYHKPRGLVTSRRDERGRATVFDSLPAGLPRLISVGRLDLASEGLLLLTNDGALARHLELPATGLVRRYRVRAHGAVDDAALARLGRGMRVDGVDYGPVRIALDRRGAANSWFTVSLREGRNREVRRLFAAIGLEVNRLIRIAYGPFQLGNLGAGAVEEVPAKVLAEQLGRAAADRLAAS